MKKKFAGHYASLRARLVGRPGHRGWLFKAMIYVLLVSIGFVYLYPVLSMFVTSLMGLPDLLDAAVKWVPTAVTLDNYREALDVMRVKETLINSVVGALLPALAQAGVKAEQVSLLNLKQSFAPQGTVAQLRRLMGIDAEAVVHAFSGAEPRS